MVCLLFLIWFLEWFVGLELVWKEIDCLLFDIGKSRFYLNKFIF